MAAALDLTVVEAGSGAPILIQVSSAAICSSESFLFFGGICRSGSLYRTALISKLASGSLGAITGPELPPLSTASGVSRRRSPLTFSAFSLETALMIERRTYGLAAAYSLASVVFSVGALFVGLFLMRRLLA